MRRALATALALAVLHLQRAAAAYGGAAFSGLYPLEVAQAPCVRLFHRTGSEGCRSRSRGGASKLPLLPLGASDFPKLSPLKAATSPVAVVLDGGLFNASALALLEATGKVGGLLVLDDSTPGDFGADVGSADACYSHDGAAPLGLGTPSEALTAGLGVFANDNARSWNAHGGGLLHRDLSFPVSLVTGATGLASVRSRAALNRRRGDVNRRPAWVADMDFYFGGDEDASSGGGPLTSARCLRWRDRSGALSPQCLPVGGQSVWGVLGGGLGSSGVGGDSRPVALAVGGMDTSSLFHDTAPQVGR